MRRVLAITLMIAFASPLIAPLFAATADPEASLPACCRTHGKHHCMMSVEEMQALLYGEHFTAVRDKCPLFPRAVAPVPHQTLFIEQSALLFAEAVSHPAQHRQTEAWARVALEGARHKRGPPASRLS